MRVMVAEERSRFFRFATVGAVGTLVDFAVFNLLTVLVGLPSVLSSVISFITAVFNNFFWNRRWTFPDSRSKPLSRQLASFFLISMIGLAIRTPLFALFEKLLIQWFNRLPQMPISPTNLAHNGALALVIGIVLFWNFFANRYTTYSDV